MKDKSYLFEAAVTELTMNVLDSGEGFLAGEGEYPLPGRLAVLAEGFAQEMDLEQVNERLKEEGFESLYARRKAKRRDEKGFRDIQKLPIGTINSLHKNKYPAIQGLN